MNKWMDWSMTGWRRWLGPELVIPMVFMLVAYTIWVVLAL